MRIGLAPRRFGVTPAGVSSRARGVTADLSGIIDGCVRIDRLVEVFNLFNRVNNGDISRIFRGGAYPLGPLPTCGRLTLAGSSLHAQRAATISL